MDASVGRSSRSSSSCSSSGSSTSYSSDSSAASSPANGGKRKRLPSPSMRRALGASQDSDAALFDAEEDDASDVAAGASDVAAGESLAAAAQGHGGLQDDERASSRGGSLAGSDDDDFDASALEARVGALRGPPDDTDKNLGEGELAALVNDMLSWWTRLPPKHSSLLQHVSGLWGTCSDGKRVSDKLAEGTLSSMDLRYVYNKEMFKRIRLEAGLRYRSMLDSAGESGDVKDVAGMGFLQALGRIQDCVARAYFVMSSDLHMRRALDPSVDAGCPAPTDPFGYVPFTQADLSEFNSLLVYVLKTLHDHGLRRYNGAVYEQIMSPLTNDPQDATRKVRYATHAWRRYGDIKQFVLEHTTKELQTKQWKQVTVAGNLNRLVEYMQICVDPEFQELKPNRHWHAFHNGLYNVFDVCFHPWGDPSIPADVVACHYNDMPFNVAIMESDWADVPTPEVEQVLSYQFRVGDKGIADAYERERVIMWHYAFMGRLLHEVNAPHTDKWQVIPFIVGRAGTGKSLLLKTVGWFFNEEDVETLANKSQQGFGLETFVDKLMWRCYEVKHDFSLDQAQLQSMVSGEPTSIQRKHKEALSVVWKIPGILAGNELASWVDNSGSMSRRVVLSEFGRRVLASSVDPNLDTKIRANIGNLLHKCAAAYKYVSSLFGDKDIWANYQEPLVDAAGAPLLDAGGRARTREASVLPKYFHENKSKFKELTHPLVSVLRNEPTIVHGAEGFCMPFARFKEVANNFFKREGHGIFKWSEERYKNTFEDFGIVKFKLDRKFISEHGGKGTKFEYRGMEYEAGVEWLVGVTEREIQEQEGSAALLDAIG